MAKVTLQAIADAAGTSKFAVSRALAGKSGVSNSTRERIVQLASEMGYQRSKLQSVTTVAVLCEDAERINGELNQKIMSGIRDEAHDTGLELIELQTTGARQLSDVAERVDALIFVGVNRPDMFAAAAEIGVPIVKIGTFEPLEQADIVRGTNYETGRVVADIFIDHGHKHLVYVRGQRNFRGRQERFNGFYASTLTDPTLKVSDLRWTDEPDLQAKIDGLLAGPNPGTAFFCAHDGLAVTILSELLSRNLSIPEDASIIGYGDYVAAQHVRPPLTTVNVPGVAFGREAIRLIRDRLTDPSRRAYSVRVQIPSEVTLRDTVAQCRFLN